jgi:hypothetical protein
MNSHICGSTLSLLYRSDLVTPLFFHKDTANDAAYTSDLAIVVGID